MRSERSALLFTLALALAAPACGSILQSPDGGGGNDSGNDGGAVACKGLDEASCQLRSDCAVGRCAAVCGGTPTFAGCYDPVRDTPPGCILLNIACPSPCSTLTDEASCTARSDCRANRCPNCNGGTTFTGCVPAATSALICPAIACPVACSTMTTKETCDARPDCHSVFADRGVCDCLAPGCCLGFSRCADGKAICVSPPLTCKVVQPECGSQYVLAYTSNCYEGCVEAAACAVN